MKSRILVCGGRKYFDYMHVDHILDCGKARWFAESFCIIQGGAPGADALAKMWAKKNGVCCINIDANWDAYGNAAGAIRNTWMLDFGLPDLVIAFRGGPGTANMIEQATKAGIDIWRVVQ